MTAFTYQITTQEEQHGYHLIKVFSGSTKVAQVQVFIKSHRLNGFDVDASYHNKGLSYALIYLGVEHLIKNNVTDVEVPDANAACERSLVACGFIASDKSIYTYKGKDESKSRCTAASAQTVLIEAVKKLLGKKIELSLKKQRSCVIM